MNTPTSAVAILTYDRANALAVTLSGLVKHCGHYPMAIFDDCGYLDNTEALLRKERTRSPDQSFAESILAEELTGGGLTVFLGQRNLGVAGNSNRALRWFIERTQCSHLCLLNDDLHVLGDFVQVYHAAHQDLDVGLWCFCDFTGETYRWVYAKVSGKSGAPYMVKILPRMTGIMMSMTRACVESIGYYDARFGKFGEEHVNYTIRARQAGHIMLNGVVQNCLDFEHGLLKHQDVETSVAGSEREEADREAAAIMEDLCQEQPYCHPYRPFALGLPRVAGARDGIGILLERLQRHALVTEPAGISH